GVWLDRWSFERRGELGPVVLDAAALSDAGLSASSLADSLRDNGDLRPTGLVTVRAPAILLTTASQFARWQGQLPAAVSAAIESAVIQGHDASGRFRTIPDWLGAGAEPHAFRRFQPQSGDWTDWESTEGEIAEAPIVVSSSVLAIAGLTL